MQFWNELFLPKIVSKTLTPDFFTKIDLSNMTWIRIVYLPTLAGSQHEELKPMGRQRKIKFEPFGASPSRWRRGRRPRSWRRAGLCTGPRGTVPGASGCPWAVPEACVRPLAALPLSSTRARSRSKVKLISFDREPILHKTQSYKTNGKKCTAIGMSIHTSVFRF
jgi:hypothetical protein